MKTTEVRIYFYNRVDGKKVDLGDIKIASDGDMTFDEIREEIKSNPRDFFPIPFDGCDIIKM